jgi:3-deoxy-7-phosphoheptulonate synthase
MSLASLAAGADGIIVEVHYNPDEALCDKDQALSPLLFTGMMKKLRRLQEALGSPGTAGATEETGCPPLALAAR